MFRDARRRVVVALGAALLAAPATQAQDLTWSTSVGYSSGSYVFDERYQSFSWLNSLTWRAGRLRVSGALPVVGQNGTAVSLIAGVPVPTGGPESYVVQRRQAGQTVPVRPGRYGRMGAGHQGGSSVAMAVEAVTDSTSVAGTGDYEVNVADPTLGAGLDLFEGTGALRAFGISGWAKVPVASVESGVGSGAWDYAAGASIALSAGETLLFVDATYWMLGDMPGLELNDALFYSAAIGRRITGDWSMLASISASTRLAAMLDPPISLGASLSSGVAGRTSFHIGANFGLSESSSDFAAYVGWSTRFPGR